MKTRTNKTPLLIFHLARPVEYAETEAVQDHLASMRATDSIQDCLLVLEHLPVITLGRSGNRDGLLAGKATLSAKGVAICQSTRGGDITYHAPGQILLYPIMKLAGENADVRAYVRKIERVAIKTAGVYGIKAFRRKGLTGAWTRHGKIAAIGVRIRRWVTTHGMSFNVNIDLSGYGDIIPCGLQGEKVTSLQRLSVCASPSVSRVRATLASTFCSTFKCRPKSVFLPGIEAIAPYFSLRESNQTHRVCQ